MSKTIKNNLFRFVTLRNPQLIDKKEEKPGFVFHPDASSGHFFPAISGASQEDKQGLLKQAGETFATSALKTRSEARLINENLYLFSSWLMRNKNALSFSEIKENVNEATSLDSNQLQLVWDNLIYQTVEKKSTYVREAMIQVLVANQFLSAFNEFSRDLSDDIIFTEEQEKEFIRRANASVVMPQILFNNTRSYNPVKPTISESQEKMSNNRIAILSAKKKIAEYKTFLEELKPIEIANKKDNALDYQKAREAYDKDIKTIIDNETPKVVTKTDEYGNTYEVTTYPNLELPKFSYDKIDILNSSYLRGKLSDASLHIFENEKLDIYESFQNVIEDISSKIKSEYKVLGDAAKHKMPKVNIGGSTINLSNRTISPYCFRSQFNTYPSGEQGLITEIATDYPNASIVDANFKLVNNVGGFEYDGIYFEMMDSGNNTMTAFFHFDQVLMGIGSSFTFSGEFTLDNGNVYEFSTSAVVSPKFILWFNGCSKLKEDDNNPSEPSIKEVQMFGVTNLGIADFRRVEQEVCCYVPGEVSHIENIMAREYKERSTRNLVSSEITTELSEERERENLTDTTTTERNEMQTEVASIINQDKSQAYGGSASVHGGTENWGFNAGAYFDSSSASSTSNSNSQAKTYAQEVTDRAMERIVQKTQTKRTSRILKEFEENNKHGFDNTKGNEHVTGVYRWVDKIYKNTLINYGKRLMYEFAIPEPSRFFKDAIWKQVENNEIESTKILPIAPTHPNDLENALTAAIQLDQLNYQLIASQYNAEVSAPPKESINVSKAFKVDFLDNGQEGNSVNGSLEIPEGYTVFNAVVSGNMYHHGDNDNKKIAISVGNKSIQEYGSQEPSFQTDVVNLSPIQNELAVSASSYDTLTASFNVTATCDRTDDAMAQWQNETFNAIMDAYYERLQEYNDAQDQDIVPFSNKEKVQFNPLHNRSLETKELKRIAIELLIAPYQLPTAKDNYEPGAFIGIRKNQEFQDHASVVKFFEQAFDWDIMSYVFYPYFYGKKADWKDLYQAEDAADPLFQAFLQSGMARTVVPVRPGFEDAVNWYMETGEIWNGQGLVMDQDDDLYVSVAEEMQTIEGVVEGTWETRLPTSLTIIQAESAALLESGLPCFCDEHSSDNTIKSSSELLGDDDSAGVGIDLLN